MWLVQAMRDVLLHDSGRRKSCAMVSPLGRKHGESGHKANTVISCEQLTDNTVGMIHKPSPRDLFTPTVKN